VSRTADFLHRELAPITGAAWEEIDEEAARALRQFLSARRLVDFSGPHGWQHQSAGTGRTEPVDDEFAADVAARRRRPLPLLELSTDFELLRSELDDIDRGSESPDLDPAIEAARRLAAAEDRLVYEGSEAGRVNGLVTASPHDALPIDDDYSRYPNTVAEAVNELRNAGVGGPYGIALGPQCHRGVIETTEKGGYPILEHLKLILGGPVVWAPSIDGAVIVSLRGGDFRLEVGQDLSVGYRDHDAETVTFWLVESATFLNLAPEAAIALRYDR
jgi:uncharacterized linocin/CFP29 family protein